jgi:NSS family neurotransmitter:Na+ symporter
MFYVLLALAALTSTISLHEVVTAFLHEEFNLTRGRAARLVTFGCIIIGIISSLSLGVMQKYTLFDKGFFDLLDFVTAKIMLPLGGLLVCIFVGWYLKRSVSYEELTNGGKLKAGLFNLYIFLLRYVAPVAIILIFINELGLI